MSTALSERLFAKAEADDLGCWIYQGPLTGNGYGVFSGEAGHPIAHRTVAHRWAYYLSRGPIPAGLVIDHLCNVRACINPEHLEAVTPTENDRRRAERRTHCSAGHEFTSESTYIRPDNAKRCRTCSAAQARARNASRRAEQAAA